MSESEQKKPEVVQGRLGWEVGDVSMAAVEELSPHPKNTEIYGDAKPGEQFTESVREKGVLEPLVIKGDKTILSGHRRWTAAEEVGIERVPVRIANFDSGLHEREALIEFNRQREKTPGQLTNEFEEILEIEQQRAKEKQAEYHGNQHERTSGNVSKSPNETSASEDTTARDKAAEKVDAGVSGRTLEKGLNVKEEAESGNETAQGEWDKLLEGKTTFSEAEETVKTEKERDEREQRREEDATAQTAVGEDARTEWGVEPGQIWEIASDTTDSPHRIACGDVFGDGVLNAVLDGSVPDVAFADPPYGIGADTNRGEGSTTGFMTSYEFPDVEGDESVETAVAAYEQLSALGIPLIVLWGANHYAEHLPSSAGWVVWDKRDGVPSDDYSDAELAWTNQDRSTRVFRHTWRGAIKASERDKRRVHPTQKPIALADYVLTEYAGSVEGVLDPFLGSGSTAVAAERAGIACYGVECVPEYTAIALERLSEAGLSPELRDEI